MRAVTYVCLYTTWSEHKWWRLVRDYGATWKLTDGVSVVDIGKWLYVSDTHRYLIVEV